MNRAQAPWPCIAVQVTGDSVSDRRVDAAILLTHWLGARLHGVHVQAASTPNEASPAHRWGVSVPTHRIDAAEALQRFIARCQSYGAECDTSFHVGPVAAALVLASHTSDLLVLTQPERPSSALPHSREGAAPWSADGASLPSRLATPSPSREAASTLSGEVTSTLRREDLDIVLRLSARPVLLLPRWWDDVLLTQRILVAWEGSGACARAVTDALPLLRRADDVQVVHLASTETANDAAPWWPPLRNWLGRHSVVAQGHQIKSGRHRDLQLQEVIELYEPDLVVMGAFGRAGGAHSLRLPWLGHTTRFMLENTRWPLLLSH